jgi:hypothetical protein
MLINTHLIAKHLPLPYGIPMNEPCALCNITGVNSIPINKVLSDGFMNTDCLGHTGSICIYCAACIGKEQNRTQWLRSTSFLATPLVLIRLKRGDIWQHIFNPPSEPFVFGVSYACKKHISFRAPVNLPGQASYRIQTESMTIEIHPDHIRELANAVQRWYTICRDNNQEPTWFNKTEILRGCRNYKRIEVYGIDQYFEDEKIIGPYRNTALLELLVFAMNKG